MTRLVYVHNIAMPGPEANTVNVAKMCAAFSRQGCEVTLAALPGARTQALRASIAAHYDVAPSFDVVPLPPPAARPALAALAGAAIAVRRRADIVYTRAPHVALAACLVGASTMLEVHTPPTALSNIGRAAFHRAAGHPSLLGMIAISDALARHLQAEHPRVNILIAHDGADARPMSAALRPENAALRVGFVGRFYRGKGVELIAQLAKLAPWAEFHLVGGEQAHAERLIGAALPNNVTIHGAVSHAEASALIDTFDVALAPYQRTVMVADGKTDAAAWMSPLKLFEYMAAGKAIIASNLPVLHEILRHGDTALLAPPDDPTFWSKALQMLRDHPARRGELGARARAHFLAHYTWDARARRILDFARAERAIAA